MLKDLIKALLDSLSPAHLYLLFPEDGQPGRLLVFYCSLSNDIIIGSTNTGKIFAMASRFGKPVGCCDIAYFDGVLINADWEGDYTLSGSQQLDFNHGYRNQVCR